VSSLFGQPWWLDAVAPGAWGEATVSRNGAVVARLPWAVDRLPVRGVKLVRLGSPKLTPFLIPELELGSGKPATRLAREHELLDALIAQLPRFDYLSYTFAPSFTNWLPFYWKGFRGSLRVTYVLDDVTDLESVWNGMTEATRRSIRKAEKTVRVQEDRDVSRLAAAVRSTFERQRRRTPFSHELLGRLDAAVRANDAGTVLTAVDHAGAVHASLMVVWDDARSYYLAGGSQSEQLGSGAQSLLLWQAVRHASTRTRSFDFEGSMIPGVARFFRGFGSRPEPYVHVTGTSRRMRLGLAARELLHALTGRR
jgi:Acetyltransferase (GNAT) domain